MEKTDPNSSGSRHLLLSLPDEDRDFILQFVLASGSLKEMAQLYGVSYPTIRASLDRIISNLRQALNGQPPDPLTELLARLIERGELKPATARTIRSVYREALERKSQ